MSKTLQLYDPVFCMTYLVRPFGSADKACDEYRKFIGGKKGKRVPEFITGAYFSNDDVKAGMFWFGKSYDIAMVAHECFHATHHVMRRSNVPLHRKSEETFAYYLGWLTERVTQCANSIGRVQNDNHG